MLFVAFFQNIFRNFKSKIKIKAFLKKKFEKFFFDFDNDVFINNVFDITITKQRVV